MRDEARALGRRQFLWTASVSGAALAVGCGGDSSLLDGSAPPADAQLDAGADAGPAPFGWREIPALTFTVGVAVEVDLRGYLDDPSGAAEIALDMPLPAGLALEDGVIRGVPTAVTPAADFVALADDGV
ncbi:MAG: hypothetical protein SangKO_088760 [Sandaracinaceae bacterium]